MTDFLYLFMISQSVSRFLGNSPTSGWPPMSERLLEGHYRYEAHARDEGPASISQQGGQMMDGRSER
jgi:hypothetical protein